MSSADLKVLSNLSLVFGLILFLGGLFADFYYQECFNWYIEAHQIYPYQSVARALLVFGIVLVAIALLVRMRAYELDMSHPQFESTTSLNIVKFCTNCGTRLPSNVKYCSNCGKKT
jgi:hypothetical protein